MKKMLALLLVLISLLSLFAGCGRGADEIVLPVQNVEETYENRVAALMETAFAFRRKNPYIQYDSTKLTVTDVKALGVRNADSTVSTPEMAGPQRTLYHVCSFYTSTCTYQTFGHREQGGWANHAITPMATKSEAAAPYTVYQVSLNDLTEARKLEAMEEFRNTLQVGDMVYYVRNKGTVNHTVIWAGDLTGDGVEDIIHVGGDYYDKETRTDVREPDGAVFINRHKIGAYSGEQFFFDPEMYDYFPTLKHVGVIRYADSRHAGTLPLTEAAKTRLLYPGLTIFFEAEKGIYGAVQQGGEYTFTLTVHNESEKDHKGLLLQLPVPKNAEIVKINGDPVKNKTIKCPVDIPAGEAAVLAYTVKATGNVGDRVETGVGYVHAIELPSLTAAITSSNPDAAAVTAALEQNKGKSGADFVSAYLQAMGHDVTVPEPAEVRRALYAKKSYGTEKLYVARDAAEADPVLYKMQIPEFFGGQSVATDIDSLRVKELRAEDLLAGDILIWQKTAGGEPCAAVHNGEALMMAQSGGLMEMLQWKLDEFIMYDFFIALRPTQAE